MRLSNPLSSFGLKHLIVESRPIKVMGELWFSQSGGTNPEGREYFQSCPEDMWNKGDE